MTPEPVSSSSATSGLVGSVVPRSSCVGSCLRLRAPGRTVPGGPAKQPFRRPARPSAPHYRREADIGAGIAPAQTSQCQP